MLLISACAAPQAAPVHNFGTRVDSAAGAGVVMVRDGDTVFGISERYRLPLRDIIDLNGLKPPYHLKTAERLQLPPPNEHKTGAGDTVTGVARLYGVPVSQIVSINKLAAPYQLRTGQVLRIPSSVPLPQQAIAVRMPPAQIRQTATAAGAQQSSTPVQSAPVRTAAAQSAAPVIAADSTPSRAGFIWPVRGKVISTYGPKPGHLHNDGINIAAPRGAAVAAAADGTVAYVGNDLASYGNLVLVRHANGLVTAYAHLDRVEVKRGDSIRRGQAIGTVGSSGTVANPQLHFEVRRGIESLDPARYLGA
ncbi:MAG: LysM peptidoglycan-binding domain-containing M23 family metallopeptidase [Alphaproteobacteria bacterium]|nr:LysM peptidoglycan-binding domain-containing M23 family metallopeptidase [Alphaproteobacteria bacterium]